MDYIHFPEIVKANTVTDGTIKIGIKRGNDGSHVWKKVGLEGDPYIDRFTIPKKIKLDVSIAINIR